MQDLFFYNTKFYIFLKSSKVKQKNLLIIKHHFDTNKTQVDKNFNNDRKRSYGCSYYPDKEGDYVVNVLFAGRGIPNSPYNVLVEGFAGDASKVCCLKFCSVASILFLSLLTTSTIFCLLFFIFVLPIVCFDTYVNAL